MAKRVVSNRTNNGVVVHVTAVTDGTETITVAGGSSDLDNDAGASGDESVTGANITQAWWGTGGGETGPGYWEVKRGANTMLILDSTGWHDYAGNGASMNLDPTADVVCTLKGADVGFLVLELQKISTVANNQYLRG